MRTRNVLAGLVLFLVVAPEAGAEYPKDLESLWADLAGDDAGKAYRAIDALSKAPKQAVPFLQERLRPVSPADTDTERLAGLIADLDHEQFAVREKASRALEQLGVLAEPALRQKLAGNLDSLEMRRRIERVLEKLDKATIPSPEQLQALRAVQVLEQLATLEAQEVLKTLATGAEGARLTQEAKASLERLAKRRGERGALAP